MLLSSLQTHCKGKGLCKPTAAAPSHYLPIPSSLNKGHSVLGHKKSFS